MASKTLKFLPSIFQTEANDKFLSATLDQLISEPNLKKIYGYIGRKFAPTYKHSDSYIQEPTSERQNYQLEPSVVIKENDSISFFSSYTDVLNKIKFYGGHDLNHDRLFNNQYYSFDPLIDYDKFINFSQYYWLENGPDYVDVYPGIVESNKTFNITRNVSNNSYSFSAESTYNPTIILARGGSYKFNLNQAGNKFWIQTNPGISGFVNGTKTLSSREVYGVENNGADIGTLTFNVPQQTVQDEYLNMPLVYTADFTTSAAYSDIHGNLVSSVFSKYNGFDGIVSQLDGKTLIFVNQDKISNPSTYSPENPYVYEDAWTIKGLYSTDSWDQNAWDSISDIWDQSQFARGTTIPEEDRVSLWTIKLIPTSNILRLSGNVSATAGSRITQVSSGASAIISEDVVDSNIVKIEYENNQIFTIGAGFVQIDNINQNFYPIVTSDDDYIIRLDNKDTSGNVRHIPINNKVFVRSGSTYAGKEFYNNYNNVLTVVPAITSILDTLYYQDEKNPELYGIIKIVDFNAWKIDVEKDILGRITYTSPNGVVFTNGLKVRFDGQVIQTEFQNKEFYVEGVGSGIRLVPVEFLVTPETYHNTLLETTNSTIQIDYILINRGSVDLNSWSRNNRWFHKNVIEVTAKYNNTVPVFDQNLRAVRPIIEFEPDIQLYNNGKIGKKYIDFLDTNINSFNSLQGQTIESIYNVQLTDGMRIVFSNDPDPLIRNKIFVLNFVYSLTDPSGNIVGPHKINLTKASDGDILEYDSIVVTNGPESGITWWFNGVEWVKSQQKIKLNQAPLFDVFDGNENSFGTYNRSSFVGTQIFGYKESIYSKTDPVLGFPLSYRNFNTQGEIEFQNYFDIDTFTYLQSPDTATESVNHGFLKIIVNRNLSINKNVWNSASELSKQYQLLSYEADGKQQTFSLPADSNLEYSSPNIKVYLNGKFLNKQSWTKSNLDITILTKLSAGDKLDVLIYTDVVLSNDSYQIPLNLDYNSQNLDFKSLTLGQLRNHVVEMAQNSTNVTGEIVGENNLRDIQYKKQGGNILQHSSPFPYVSLFLNNDNCNYIESIRFAQQEYSRFKNKFLELSVGLPGVIPGDPVYSVDLILQSINGFKNGNFPWYYSDMVPYGSQTNVIENVVYDPLIKNYEISNIFNDTELSNKSVLVYLDADPNSTYIDGSGINVSYDILNKTEYVSPTGVVFKNGSRIRFGKNVLPQQYQNKTYEVRGVGSDITLLPVNNNVQLVKGRDYVFDQTKPSIVISDQLNLEIDYKLTIVEYSNTDGNYIPETPTKLGLYPKYTPEIVLDRTYITDINVIIGHDGSKTPAFGDYRDDFLLELEKRIYNNIKSDYNKNQFDVYDVIPGKFRKSEYTLTEFDEVLSTNFLTWVGNNSLDYSSNSTFKSNDPFTWNYALFSDNVDNEKLPGSWRAIFKYFYDTETPNYTPWEMLGFSEKPTWWEKHYGPAPYTGSNDSLWEDLTAGLIREGSRSGIDSRFSRPELLSFIPVNENGFLRSPPEFLTVSFNEKNAVSTWAVGNQGPVETAWRRSSEFPYAIQIAMALSKPAQYFGSYIDITSYNYNKILDQYLNVYNKQHIKQTSIRLNGDVSSNQVIRTSGYINWIVDFVKNQGRNPYSTISTILNSYQVNLSYKLAGFSDKKFLRILAEQYSPTSTNDSIVIPYENYNIFLNKSTPVEKIVYSAVIVQKTHNGYTVRGYNLENPYFTIVPSIVSGNSSKLIVLDETATVFNDYQLMSLNVPYGYEFKTAQQLVDFLISYERYLKTQGFVFEDVQGDLGEIQNWQLSAKEFLYWIQQGWAVGSILVLSPINNSLKVKTLGSIVDSITDDTFGSKVIDQNFKMVRNIDYNVTRSPQDFSVSLLNQQVIGLVELNLVQYEHVVIFDNITVFNDVIYKPELGNRQYRLKLIGQKTAEWDGSLSPSGFIYNSSTVQKWNPGVDYLKGDLVEFKNQYFVALDFVIASDQFAFSNWKQINISEIKTGLLPNFSYNAWEGKTYYDNYSEIIDSNLTTNNTNKSLYSYGLIGFKSRPYLNDLGLTDSTQLELYKGFVAQKGTKNSVTAMTKAQFNDISGQIDFYEDWAVRVGEYGAIDINPWVEVELDETLYSTSGEILQFVDKNQQYLANGLNVIGPNNLYKSSADYNGNIALNRTNKSDFSNDIMSAGYVSINDVDLTIFDMTNYTLLNSHINKIGSGYTIWCAKDFDTNWNVYRVTETNNTVTAVSNALNGLLSVTCKDYHKLSVNSLILIKNFNSVIDGFYQVQKIINLNTILVQFHGTTTITTLSGSGLLYQLDSLRFDYFEDSRKYTPLNGWKLGEKIWIDSVTSDNQWAVYERKEPWTFDSIIKKRASEYQTDDKFGYSLKMNDQGTIFAVGSPYNTTVQILNTTAGSGIVDIFVKTGTDKFESGNTQFPSAGSTQQFGYSVDIVDNYLAVGAPASESNTGHVYIYEIAPSTSELKLIQILKGESGDQFGHALSFSRDQRWLYISAVGNKKVYAYSIDHSVSKHQTIEVVSSTNNIVNLSWTPVSKETILISGPGVSYIYGQDYTITNNTITFNPSSVPVSDINIIVEQTVSFRQVHAITSPSSDTDNFGYSIGTSADGTQLSVGAPSSVVNGLINAGKVYVYDRSIEAFISNNQTSYTTKNSLSLIDRVYVDNTELKSNQYSATGNTVTLSNIPELNSTVIVETNNFKLVQVLTGSNPQEHARFGSSIAVCSFNCAIYVGAPGQDLYTGKQNEPDNQSIVPQFDRGIIINGGAVIKHHNQGRLYGTIAGTISNPTVNSGDSIRINNIDVVFSGSTLQSVVDDINNLKLIGVSALVESRLVTQTYLKNSIDNKWYDSNSVLITDTILLSYLESTTLSVVKIDSNRVTKRDNKWYNEINLEITDSYYIGLLENNKYLRINSYSTIKRNKLRITAGSGSAITDLGLEVFAQMQVITSPDSFEGEQFGTKVSLNTSANSLVISSTGGKTNISTTFDNNKLTLDNVSTEFVDGIDASGSVYLFELYDDPRNNVELPGRYSYTQQFNPGTILLPGDQFGCAVDIVNNYVLVTSPNSSAIKEHAGTLYLFKNPTLENGWTQTNKQQDSVDINSVSRIYLYNKVSDKILVNLDFIDPIKGKIFGKAEQEITYKTSMDPAVYNKGFNTNVNISQTNYWNSKQKYQVWWNLDQVRYINYEQGDLTYKSLNWGSEFPESDITVCEWTESEYLPSQYVLNKQDGVPLYPNDSAYVETVTIDPIIGSIVIKYYFWVKNKSSLDAVNSSRTLPVNTIAKLIRSPEVSGIPYAAIIQNNALTFYNIENYLSDKDTVLHIDYVKNIDNSIIHSEYELVQNNSTNFTTIPNKIVNKLVDSLAGIDRSGKLVPDPKLNDASKYGISIRPRQTMFVDKNKALSLVLTYLNTQLKHIRFDNLVQIQKLENAEQMPAASSNEWNIKVPTYDDLYYLDINLYTTGYRVLVESDSTQDNLWVIYTKNKLAQWEIYRVQSYNTKQYWSYTDWYKVGYDDTIEINYNYPTYKSFTSNTFKTGSIVKIQDSGNGKWVIVKVINSTKFETIAIQDGTIAIDVGISNYTGRNLGYDNQGFGLARFDQDPGIEIRNILQSLLDQTLSDVTFKKLLEDVFFMIVNYLHNEQSYIDWIFKTSFITVVQQLRSLVQSPNYINDNQTFYEDYINEVKPYKTKIREYILNYTGIDTFSGSVTDFDVPPYYDAELKRFRSPSGEYPEIDSQLWQQPIYKHWYDNRTYEIGSFVIENPGVGYTLTPIVEIISKTGSGAKAHAVINVETGQLIDIVLDNPGSGYESPVIVKINGNGTGAAAYAVYKQNQPRGITTTIKFDRISYDSNIPNWSANTVYKSGDIIRFDGNAYQYQYDGGNTISYNSGDVFDYTNVDTYSPSLFDNANDRIVGYYTPGYGLPSIDVINESIITSNLTINSNRIYVQSVVDDGNGNDIYIESVKNLKPGMFIGGENIKSSFITKVVANVSAKVNYIEVDTQQSIASNTILAASFNDLGQVVSGLDYPGTQITGQQFEENPGYGVNPRFGSVFDPVEYDVEGIPTLSSNSYDTIIQSTYTDILLGTRPEDINVDGGKYHDKFSGHAPEELIPGHVYDTLDMKVYTQVGSSTLGYRIFNNMNKNISYLRLSGNHETTLISNLNISDSSIIVNDALVLPNPDRTNGVPGVVFINGERITYYRNYHHEVVDWESNVLYPEDTILSHGNLVVFNSSVVATHGTYITQASTGANAFVLFDTTNNKVYVEYQNNNNFASGNIVINGTEIHVDVVSSKLAYYKTVSSSQSEYFYNSKVEPLVDNNINVLTQLRRGTEGTSVPLTHLATSLVTDASIQQVIPNTSVRYTTVSSNVYYKASNTISYKLTVSENITANVGDFVTQDFISGANATVLHSVVNSKELLISYNSNSKFLSSNIMLAGYGLSINNTITNTYPVTTTIAGFNIDETGNVFVKQGTTVIKDKSWYKLGLNTPTDGSGFGSGGYYDYNNTDQEKFLWESTYR